MMASQKNVPLSGLITDMIFEKDSVRRFIGFVAQWHIRFVRSVITFFSIAFFTRCNQIHPAIRASFGARDNMIDG
jgi:hypothetical protein